MPTGTYTLVVDALWNKLALEKSHWRNIRVNIQAPGALRLTKMNQQQGLTNLNKFFTDDAILKCQKKGVATDFPGEHSNAHRYIRQKISKKCWLGYLFTHNKQVRDGYPLHESL